MLNGDEAQENEVKTSGLGLCGPYLTEQDCENMKRYRYKGGDDGLMYIHFYNPVCTWLVSKLPDWLA